MANFFVKFPRILYDIDNRQLSNFQFVTNLLFRVKFVRDVLNNTSAYYEHVISDTETPEILADLIYDDPEAHWVILLANEMVDPQYDWPMNSRVFPKYIANKYRQQAADDLAIDINEITDVQVINWTQDRSNLPSFHHFEKVIERTESFTGITTETRFIVSYTRLTDNDLNVPFDFYTGLPTDALVETIDMGNGRTVIQTTRGEAITYYDYENDLNESKRTIKIIKPEYYGQIYREYERITNSLEQVPYYRRLT